MSPSAIHPNDASSIASEGGGDAYSHQLHNSLMGSGSAQGGADDVHSPKQTVAAQQQRIDALEGMHQQALRQLRKSREELVKVQQQRHHEADRVLRLEQLISEMQAQRFVGNPGLQHQWDSWLSRARATFEDVQE